MSIVGSPLFAAPELMLGRLYNEVVDVYSYGMVLLSLSVAGGDLRELLKRRWRRDHSSGGGGGSSGGGGNGGAVPLGQVVKGMWEGWRPVVEPTNVKGTCSSTGKGSSASPAFVEESAAEAARDLGAPGAPASVTSLIVRCCAQDPTERPSFKQVRA